MTDAPRTTGDAHPRVPLITWPLLAVFAIAAAGLAVALAYGKVDIPVPKRNLPPYHRIEAGDLGTRDVWRQGLDDSVLRGNPRLEGRVTRHALRENDPIRDDALTSVVGASAFDAVRLKLHPQRSSLLGVQPGNHVRLHLAPTGDAAELQPLTFVAVLLDTAEASDGTAEYVVLVKHEDLERLLSLLGRSQLLVTPAR